VSEPFSASPARVPVRDTYCSRIATHILALRCHMQLIRALIFVGLLSQELVASGSTCFGTTANGRLEGGVRLPGAGPNYSSYSSVGMLAGRTFVHDVVAGVVTSAYQALEKSSPGKVFVYGETGWEKGGRFRQHRTHQNGLSVDFMVPVLDRQGKSVPLPTNIFNKYGYDIDFDTKGEWGELRIDFEAIGEHLFQLDKSAREAKSGIALVIFDVDYLPKLFATRRGDWLKSNVQFMQKQAWVRHDDHYHVDFAIPCKPLSK
jgi:penicillin-insensitive murein DD-endopeptidase